MLKEFKNFIMTGNVMDLAIAVILAGAVSGVVKGFVNLIMMPLIGHFSGGVDFAELSYVLSYKLDKAGQILLDAETGLKVVDNAIMYGEWINTLINLVIVGFVLFMIVRAYNKTKKKKEEEAPAPPAGPTQEELLSEIRDLLKK